MSWYSNSNTKAFTSLIFNSPKPDGKKIRETYDLEGLCHAWASGNVPRGRSGSSMFFEDGIIYSYGRHYEAAKIFGDTVLINSDNYSPTTRNHLRHIRKATSNLKKINVPNVNPTDKTDHDNNIEYLSDIIVDNMKGIFLGLKHNYMSTIEDKLLDINQYCLKFKIKNKLPHVLDRGTYELLTECRAKINLKNKSRDDKRKLREETKLKEIELECQGELKALELNFPIKLQEWRDGLITNYQLREACSVIKMIPAPFGRTKHHRVSLKISEYSYLRINGETVETSSGASVPLSHALRLLSLIEQGAARQGERVGHYTFNAISDTTKEPVIVTIGCHKILLSEAREVLK